MFKRFRPRTPFTLGLLLALVALGLFLLPGPGATPLQPAARNVLPAALPAPALPAPAAPAARPEAPPARALDPEALALQRARARLKDGPAAAAGLSPEISLQERIIAGGGLPVRALEAHERAGGRLLASRRMVAGEMLVGFAAAVDEAAARAWLAARGLTALKRSRTGNVWRAGLPAGTVLEEAIARHEGESQVAWVEPNYVIQLDNTPDDPRLGDLWGLAKIQAEQAWELTTGSRQVLVAVVDTGVDYTHPDLAANIWTNPYEIPGNGADDDNNGFVDDVHGYDFVNEDGDPLDDHFHGTHCAGTIGAVGDNGRGVAGVNWKVSIMALKFLTAEGWGNDFDAAECLDYATLQGVTLTSNSWGSSGYSLTLQAAVDRAEAAGVLLVAAAGNDAKDTDEIPHYPSCLPNANIISVAATDDADELASFSCYGAESVDLGAPGVGILSTIPTVYEDPYYPLSGTSMATPHVAGALALLKSLVPEYDGAQLKARLLASVDPLPALNGRSVSGGRLNVSRLLEAYPDSQIVLRDLTVLDDGSLGTAGNGDGVANPGETVGLLFTAHNIGGQAAAGLTAALATSDGRVTLLRAEADLGDLASRAARPLAEPFLFQVAADCPTPHPLPLLVLFRDQAGRSWTSKLPLAVEETLPVAGVATLDGQPLAGARILFHGPRAGRVTSAADGSWHFGATAGNYQVHAELDGALASAPLALAVSQPVAGLNFAFATAGVSGRVTDALTGQPVAGATVASAGDLVDETASAADGSWSLTGIFGRPGNLALTARSPAYFASLPVEVQLPPDRTGVDFALGVADLAVAPAALAVTAPADQTATRALTLTNAGGRELDWWVWQQQHDAGLAAPAQPAARVLKTHVLPFETYWQLAGIACDGQVVYLLNLEQPSLRLVTLDPASGKVLADRAINVDGGQDISSIAWDGRQLLLAAPFAGRVYRYDPRANEVRGYLSTVAPWTIACGDGVLFVTPQGSDYLYRYNAATGQFLNAVPIDPAAGEVIFGGVDGLGYENGRLWLTCMNSPEFYKLDPATGRLLETVANPFSSWYDSANLGGFAGDGRGHLWTVDKYRQKVFLLATGDAPAWLAAEPLAGQVPAAAAGQLTLRLDGAAAGVGTHRATLYVNGNDPDQPAVAVPVTFTVTAPGAPPAAPLADLQGPAAATAGQPVSFSAAGSSDADGTIVSYRWDFGDGYPPRLTAGPETVHAFQFSGDCTVRVTVTDDRGLSAEAALAVAVSSPSGGPAPGSGLGGRLTQAKEVRASATDGQSGALVWDAPGAPVAAADLPWIAAQYNSRTSWSAWTTNCQPATTDSIKAYVAGLMLAQWGKQLDAIIRINPLEAVAEDGGEPQPPPLALFAAADPVAGQAPLAVQFTSSVEGQTEPVQYAWDFGDGQTSPAAEPRHDYAAPGVYLATLTATDAADLQSSWSIDLTVTAAGSAPASLAVTASALPDLGAAPLAVQLDGQAAGGQPPYSASWTIRDVYGAPLATLAGPRANYTCATAGVYEAELAVSDSAGAAGADRAQIVATEPSQGYLDVDILVAPEEGPAPLTVNLEAAAVGGTGNYTYAWVFSSVYMYTVGSSDQRNPTFTFREPGYYIVECCVSDGLDTVEGFNIVSVEDAAPACVLVDCGEVKVNLSNGSSASLVWDPPGTPVDLADYDWIASRLGRRTNWSEWVANCSTTTRDAIQNHVADLALAQKGAALTGLVRLTPKVIEIQQSQPEPLGATAGCSLPGGERPLAVDFYGQASGGQPPYTWSWNFADGSAPAAAKTAAHTYTATGLFTAQLTVTDAAGAVATATVPVKVADPLLLAGLTVDRVFGAAPLTVHFQGLAEGGVPPFSFAWDFADGWADSGPDATHVFAQPGDYLVRLTVGDSGGQEKTLEQRIVVSAPVPVPLAVVASADATAGPAPLAVNFSAAASGGAGPAACAWEFADLAGNLLGTAQGAQASFAFAAEGWYLATVLADDGSTVAWDMLVLHVGDEVAPPPPPPPPPPGTVTMLFSSPNFYADGRRRSTGAGAGIAIQVTPEQRDWFPVNDDVTYDTIPWLEVQQAMGAALQQWVYDQGKTWTLDRIGLVRRDQ